MQSNPSKCPLATAIHIGIWVGLSAGAVDGLLNLLVHGRSPVGLLYLGLGFSVVALPAWILFWFVWFVIMAPISRRAGWDGVATALGVAYGCLAGFVAAILTGILPPVSTPGYSFALNLVLLGWLIPLLAVISGIGVFHMYGLVRDRPRMLLLLLAAHLAAPAALASTGLSLWFLTSSYFNSPDSPTLAVAAVGSGSFLLFAAVGWVALRIRWTRPVLVAFAVVMVVLPWMFLREWHHGIRAPTPPGELAPRHVFLIVVDTLRSDMLSCYGSDEVSTPHIDSLAADGVLFTHAMSPAPWTLPAMASIMTGVSPLVHRATGMYDRIPDELKTMAEYLGDSGYHTGAIGNNALLGAPVGIHQGFDDFFWYPVPIFRKSLGGLLLTQCSTKYFGDEVSTERLANLALDWIDNHAKQPFFLWWHVFDPHLPYTPPKRYLPSGETPDPEVGLSVDLDLMQDIRKGILVPDDNRQRWIRRLYESEVRYVDEQVGRLVARIKELGIYDEALIILTSDHGEEFWEHGGFEHGHTLYNEQLHVPLIVKLPRGSPAERCETLVCTQNILPTVLDLCNVAHDPESLSGSSLRPHWQDNRPSLANEPIYATGMLYYQEREALFFNSLKYIHALQDEQDELYDMNTDPGEKHSLIPGNPEGLSEARAILRAIREKAQMLRVRHGVMERSEDDAVSRNRTSLLKSLGYL